MAVVYNKDKFGNKLTVDQMLKKFKQKVAREEIMENLKNHEAFVPKALKRRKKSEKYQKIMRKIKATEEKFSGKFTRED